MHAIAEFTGGYGMFSSIQHPFGVFLMGWGLVSFAWTSCRQKVQFLTMQAQTQKMQLEKWLL